MLRRLCICYDFGKALKSVDFCDCGDSKVMMSYLQVK